MTLFEFDDTLAPIRTGRFADAATVVAWLVAIAVTVVTPLGLAIAGVVLAIPATSVRRAVASAGSFSIVVVGAVWLWSVVTGVVLLFTLPLPAEAVALTVLVLPPAIAAVVRAIG